MPDHRRGAPPELLAELVERITAAGGVAIAIPYDLADLDAVDPLVARSRNVGHVDILINNAGRPSAAR